MTEEQLVEKMARDMRAVAIGPILAMGRDLDAEWTAILAIDRAPYLNIATATLTAIRGAGLVIMPREPTPEMLEAGRKAWKKPRLHVSHTASDELMTCGVIHRAMVEAGKIGDE